MFMLLVFTKWLCWEFCIRELLWDIMDTLRVFEQFAHCTAGSIS